MISCLHDLCCSSLEDSGLGASTSLFLLGRDSRFSSLLGEHSLYSSTFWVSCLSCPDLVLVLRVLFPACPLSLSFYVCGRSPRMRLHFSAILLKFGLGIIYSAREEQDQTWSRFLFLSFGEI